MDNTYMKIHHHYLHPSAFCSNSNAQPSLVLRATPEVETTSTARLGRGQDLHSLLQVETTSTACLGRGQDHHSLLQVETTSTACLGRRQDHHSLLQSGARSTSSTTSNVWRARPTGRSPVLFLQTEDIFAKMEAVAAIHWQGGDESYK